MKDYNCPTCKKMIPVDRSKIKAGDEVSFCRVTQSSKSARFSSRDIRDVSPVDAPSPLTYAFVGTCECKEAEHV
ncbi:hypothetical protein [Acinetobacter baumannii]